MCSYPDPSSTFDIEFPRRTNQDYVLLKEALPALSAFTISLFVSFTDPGDKTYFNYFAQGKMNEIFFHERAGKFYIWIKKMSRLVKNLLNLVTRKYNNSFLVQINRNAVYS